MRLREATEMLAGSGIEVFGPTIWADLGCGDGTFTLALADLLASGSIIHAVDLDGSALRRTSSAHKGVRITTHRADFMKQPWPFADLDGILMANSLHYVEDQSMFVRGCEPYMKSQRRFLIVEYDTSQASRWVPYPVSQTKLTTLGTDGMIVNKSPATSFTPYAPGRIPVMRAVRSSIFPSNVL
jgi:ubiquinone/menaquinone biosynthesis C-methylase UbiE